jgi:hypothetical protein
MADITPTLIANRLGVTVSVPAATNNTGPKAGDIGADSGGSPTRAVLKRVFDVGLTVANGGDTVTFNIPDEMQLGLGLDITVLPQNATARTGSPVVQQTATQVVMTFDAAAAGATYRVVFDAMHSLTR